MGERDSARARERGTDRGGAGGWGGHRIRLFPFHPHVVIKNRGRGEPVLKTVVEFVALADELACYDLQWVSLCRY